MVGLTDAIQGPDTREGNLVQKVCGVFHLRLLEEDDMYPWADLPGSGSKILSRLNPLLPEVVTNIKSDLLLYPWPDDQMVYT